MFAYILGPLLFGWYGIFLGPMLLVLVVHFVRIVLPELLAGTPIEPYSVDPTHVVADGPDDPEPTTSGPPTLPRPGRRPVTEYLRTTSVRRLISWHRTARVEG